MGWHRSVLSECRSSLLREARPEEAVPAGRMGFDLDADRLLLYTLQSPAAFGTLNATGVLRPDPGLAESDFAEAYDWMYRQMNARLTTSGEGALWLWARTTRERLVDSCRHQRGDILLTCRVERERDLLSHFMDWHVPLNRGLLVPALAGETEADYWGRFGRAWDDFDARLKAAGADWHAPMDGWPGGLRAEMEASWEHIFDLSRYGRFETWQATVHELYEGDVVDAVRIL